MIRKLFTVKPRCTPFVARPKNILLYDVIFNEFYNITDPGSLLLVQYHYIPKHVSFNVQDCNPLVDSEQGKPVGGGWYLK